MSSSLHRLKENVKLAYFRYEVTTALYMLDTWEKAIFSTFVHVLSSF
jgi:hypothetical protein